MILRNKILSVALALNVLGICAVADDMRLDPSSGRVPSKMEKEFADSSQPPEIIRTYPKITTTYGGVFENVDVLRVGVGSIYCRSQIGYCDIPFAHLPSEVLTDLDHFISQAKALALQKEKEEERKRIEAERERVQAEEKRREAERLRIYNEEQARKQREEQQAIQEEKAARLIHDDKEVRESDPNDDPNNIEAVRITPFITHIIIIIIVGSRLSGLFGRKKHHKISS